jgi:uncharacterized membrane protein YhdT
MNKPGNCFAVAKVWIIGPMNANKALWQAIATVCIPNLIFWIVVALLVHRGTAFEDWPLYLLFFAIPLPLIYPVYRRYKRSPSAATSTYSPRQHRNIALLYALLAIAYITIGGLPRRFGWHRFYLVGLAIVWIGLATIQIYRAIQAKRSASAEDEIDQSTT